eukprot:SAG11_NODE_6112_length_1386_cov_1.847708_1_plen_129_part_10
MIGRDCDFLTGDGTDARTGQRLRQAMASGASCTVRLLNYRKNGSSFMNQVGATIPVCGTTLAFCTAESNGRMRVISLCAAQISLIPVHNSESAVVRFFAVQTDVTAGCRLDLAANQRQLVPPLPTDKST